jgi:membrane protein
MGAQRSSNLSPRGWWEILKRVKAEMKDDSLTLIAAGVAFYATLAIFPAIIAVVMVYGLVADPEQIESQLAPVTGAMPEEAKKLLIDQLRAAASVSSSGLTLGLVVSLAAVLWSASTGVQTLITGLNIVYGRKETRGFVRLRGLALLFTVGGIVAAVLALVLVTAFPVVLNHLGIGSLAAGAVNAARWILLAVLVVVALGVLYRYGPDREDPQWRWTSLGVVIAVILWLLGSAAFSFYVSNFSRYDKVYGTLAAVIILMLWLWLSSLVALLGAEIDAEIERGTETGAVS